MSTIPGTGALTPLSEVVDELAMLQGNAKRNHYLAYLKHAQRIWEDALRTTIWSVRQKKIDVLAGGIVELPNDVERFMSIAVVDNCGNIQSLTQNPNLNTLVLDCPPQACSCTNCNGKDSLCEILDDITMSTETIVLDGDPYIRKAWVRMDTYGNLESVVDTPVWDVATASVVRDVQHKIIAALEVDEKCCIVPTDRNRDLLFTHCGCFLSRCDSMYGYRRRGQVDSRPFSSDFGHWKWEANSNQRIHIQNSTATQVIVMYQCDGSEVDGEMLIPGYAINLMHFGIMWRQKAFSAVASQNDISQAEKRYEKAKTRLRQFLNPIDVSEFRKLSSIIAKWG